MTTETTTVNTESTNLTSKAVMNGLKNVLKGADPIAEADKLIPAKKTVIKPKPFAPGLKTLGQKSADILPIVAKKSVKPVAKKAVKPVAKKAPAKKAAKPVAKKALAKKTAELMIDRKTSLFSLTAKGKLEDMGEGQRAAIAKVLKKHGAATRAQLIATLPEVSPANISWHLSMMVGAKLAKKAAQ